MSHLATDLQGCRCQQMGPVCLACSDGWGCCEQSPWGWLWLTDFPHQSLLLHEATKIFYTLFSLTAVKLSHVCDICVPVLVVAGRFQSHPPMAFCCWMLTVGAAGGTGELRPIQAQRHLSQTEHTEQRMRGLGGGCLPPPLMCQSCLIAVWTGKMLRTKPLSRPLIQILEQSRQRS